MFLHKDPYTVNFYKSDKKKIQNGQWLQCQTSNCQGYD